MRSASSATKSGWMMRRLWCRVFGHGSGKKDPYLLETGRIQLTFEHRLGRRFDGPDVAQTQALEPEQQRADARLIDFEAQQVPVGPPFRPGQQGLTHAEADLESERGVTPEALDQVQRLARRFEAIARERLEGARLSSGHAAAAADVGARPARWARWVGHRFRGWIAGAAERPPSRSSRR
jgi:hypothetical protein